MANQEAYWELKAEAKRFGFPKHYRTDLTKLDRGVLSRKTAPESFLWVLRECGTHLFPFKMERLVDWAKAVAQTWPDALFYAWENGKLRRLSRKTFLDMAQKVA